MAKNNPTEQQINSEIQATLKHFFISLNKFMCKREKLWKQARKFTEEKIQSLSLQIAKIDLNYKLQLLAFEYVLICIIFCYL